MSAPATELVLGHMDYRALAADLRVAAWCTRHVDTPDDAQLLASFVKIHDAVLKAIDRTRPELFVALDRAWLVGVIRRWIAMYLRCVSDVRARFPRTDESADLIVLDRNWSEQLDIAFEGLDRIGIASRYAEYWAERSVTWATTRRRGEGVFETFAARMAFIGSPAYLVHDALMRAQRLMVRDGAGNAVPSFDLFGAVCAAATPGAVEAECARREWRVESLEAGAREALWAMREVARPSISQG